MRAGKSPWRSALLNSSNRRDAANAAAFYKLNGQSNSLSNLAGSVGTALASIGDDSPDAEAKTTGLISNNFVSLCCINQY